MPDLTRLTRFRRDLHQIPELGDRLPLTEAYLRQALQELDCTLITGAGRSLLAFFDGGKPFATAFRSDMDALPVEEKNTFEYRSLHRGQMHACGHDGHMAMGLELAYYVNEHLRELPCNVLLVFQPAEETTGGSKKICDSGVFETYQVKQIFGFHLWPWLPAHVVGARPGPLMALSSEVNIFVEGRCTHVGKSQNAPDALAAGCLLVCRTLESLTAELTARKAGTLKFGLFQSGTARNIISGSTHIKGSLRLFEDKDFEPVTERLRQLAAETEKETGCGFRVEFHPPYLPVHNNEALYRRLVSFLGPDAFLELEEPTMIAEDFSFYQRRLPGVFFFLGTGGPELLHSDRFDFDEAVLETGVRFAEKLLHFS
ncbi:MAG: amidohydrolase [Bacillota bacterium]|nr:amidohydrolase [Bacillota bacterium]